MCGLPVDKIDEYLDSAEYARLQCEDCGTIFEVSELNIADRSVLILGVCPKCGSRYKLAEYKGDVLSAPVGEHCCCCECVAGSESAPCETKELAGARA